MTLCPFFKDECKGNQCIIWKNESCLIANFLQAAVSSDELGEGDVPSNYYHVAESSIPEYFKSVSPEDIASEYMEFLKREFPDSESSSYGMFDLFLQSKGLDGTFNLPVNINLKVAKARILTEQMRDKQRQQDVEKEKDLIPNLVDQCIDWARASGLKTLRKSDLETFLIEKGYEITGETERAVYSITNTKLKFKK